MRFLDRLLAVNRERGAFNVYAPDWLDGALARAHHGATRQLPMAELLAATRGLNLIEERADQLRHLDALRLLVVLTHLAAGDPCAARMLYLQGITYSGDGEADAWAEAWASVRELGEHRPALAHALALVWAAL